MNLRTKFSLALLSLALVPLGILTGILMRINLRSLEKNAQEYRAAVADSAKEIARHTLNQVEVELGAISAVLGQSDISTEDRQHLARALLLGGKYIRRIAVYDPQGQHVFTLGTEDTHDHLQRPSPFAPGLLEVARTEGFITLAVSRTPGGQWMLPVLTTIYDPARKIYGLLWSAFDLTSLCEDVGILSEHRLGRRSNRVFFIDQKLSIVIHANRAQIGLSLKDHGIVKDLGNGAALNMDGAYSTYFERDGEPFIGAITPMPQLGWAVVVEQPRQEALADARHTWEVALVVGGAFSLIAIIVGLIMGRRLTLPIAAVSKAATRVAQGNFNVAVSVSSNDEVGQLADAFNKMALDLRTFKQTVIEETRIRTDLSRYLSAELVEQIVSSESRLQLGGERREVTVLFADVVAFTNLAEEHQPEHIVSILNELFSFLTEIVFKHGGTVDKFIGDCVMAVFGAPYAHPDDPLRAVRTAEEMLRWLEAGNTKWCQDLGRELQLGIGLHTGEAVAGNVGSQKRMEYTVIGDTVNIAARLESLAQPGQVLMTRATYDRVKGEFDGTSLGMHKIVGRHEEVEILALVD